MPNCTQVAGAVKEQVVVGAGKKGFFRRIAEKMGLAQREADACKGKSIKQMAERETLKEQVAFIKSRIKTEESCLEGDVKTLDAITEMIKRHGNKLEEANHNLLLNGRRIERPGQMDFTSVPGDCYERGGFYETYAGHQDRINGYKKAIEYNTKEIDKLYQQKKALEETIKGRKTRIEEYKHKVENLLKELSL